MLLKDLIEKLQAIQKEAEDGAHPGIPREITVLVNYTGPATLDLKEIDLDAKIIAIEPELVPGCQCLIGAYLIISVFPEKI